MFGSLKLTVALAAVAVTNGQMMRDQPPSSAVSWSRSSSFFQGRDGKMHKEVRESKQMFNNGQIVKEVDLDCRDAHCQKRMAFLAPRVQPAEVLNALMGEVRSPMAPEALLERLQAANRGMVEPEVLVVSDAPPQRIPQGFLDKMRMKATPKPEAPLSPCVKGHLLVCLSHNKDLIFVLMGLFGFALMLVMPLGFIAGYRSVIARERPLQALGEPLVPEAVEEGVAEAVVAEKAGDVQPVASPKEGVSMYVARLYARALA